MAMAIIIICSLFTIGISTSIYIIKKIPNTKNRITTLIQLWTCVAAFVSVVVIIHSYKITNRAFVLSQKPHLLLRVRNAKKKHNIKETLDTFFEAVKKYAEQDGNKESKPSVDIQDNSENDTEHNLEQHLTEIFYENTSKVPFYDLSINVIISMHNKNINLSEIFTPNMYMAPKDKRIMSFPTKGISEFYEVDFEAMVESKEEIILSLSYEFTFQDKKELIEVQKYIWTGKNWRIK